MIIYTPFNKEQIKNIKEYQKSRVLHPFTCENRFDKLHQEKGFILEVNEDGFYCPSCDYKQNWCHDYMCDEEKRKRMESYLIFVRKSF